MDRQTKSERARIEIERGRCPILVPDRDYRGSHTCGRPIRTEGADRCNFHLSVDRRAKEKDAARRRADEARAVLEDRARDQVADLRRRLRVDRGVAPYYVLTGLFASKPDLRRVVIDVEILDRLIGEGSAPKDSQESSP